MGEFGIWNVHRWMKQRLCLVDTTCVARLRSNVGYFRISYGVVFTFFMVYFLLTSPFLLFELALVVGVWVSSLLQRTSWLRLVCLLGNVLGLLFQAQGRGACHHWLIQAGE